MFVDFWIKIIFSPYCVVYCLRIFLIIFEDVVQSFWNMWHLCGVILISSSTHTPIKYRCSIKKSNRILSPLKKKYFMVPILNKENQLLFTNEPIEFEKQPVDAQDFRKFTHHFRDIRGIHLKLIKKTRKIRSCNQLDLETLEFSPIKGLRHP